MFACHANDSDSNSDLGVVFNGLWLYGQVFFIKMLNFFIEIVISHYYNENLKV